MTEDAIQLLRRALDTEPYVDRWGPRCDVFDLPGMDSRAYLKPAEDTAMFEFAVYPGDTLTQAREFYRRPTAVEGVRRLARQAGWHVTHRFHFGHMEASYVWTSGDIDINNYVDLWMEEIEHARAISRMHWADYFDWLVEQRIAAPQDQQLFDRCFTETNRQTATPRPAVKVARRLHAHDTDARLVAQIRSARDTIIEALGGSRTGRR